MNSNKKQNRHSAALKKNLVGLIGILTIMSLTACGNKPEASEGDTQKVQTEQETAKAPQEAVKAQQETAKAQQEAAKAPQETAKAQQEASKAPQETAKPPQEAAETSQETETMADGVYVMNEQAVGSTEPERTAEELLDLFINGSISAADSADSTSALYITDLNMDSGEWDSYSVGERFDLDNDGENELIICGPYGGIYLDARDNKVYKFAGGDGTALILSYTWYNGDVWIMYSNRSSAGFECYHMERFEGADNLVAEMNFGEEFDINNAEAGLKYTLNGTEISYDEYTAWCSKIFAAEVSTN